MPEGSRGSFHEAPMDDDSSPRHSAASGGSTERAPSATPSDGSDPPSADRRPLSLVSTLSSGSASSRDDCQAPPPTGASSPTPSGEDIDLEPIEEHVRRGRGFGGVRHNHNNHDDDGGSASPAGRTAFRRQPKVAAEAASVAMAPGPQLSYVDRVVMEIIETERMYVRDLRMIVEDYLAHIIDHADLSVGPELVCSLFGNIEDIYEFNSELLQSLDQCDNDPVAIARCFVMKSEYFDIYTQYCTNYPNSVAALTECMRNKSLAKFFRERQASLKRSLPLGSYLLKPVQRILKYHLLLQEIAKHSDQQGADYEVVEEAIYTMTGVAWYINDMKRRHEHAVRLQEVQSLMLHWKGPDLTTYGELVLEGTFKVHRAKNERTLFLFDRMLLITKRRGEHYVYKANISCSTLMLMESAKDSLSFSVTHYKHPKQSHTVQARNLEEKKLWSHHIKRIILENHHAIIPQKAKEAILEMDSIYPSKYRYSPDRLKKALSVQTDEILPTNRQGRRQSEPIKKLFEGTKAVLKHAVSEGAVPGEEEVSRGSSLGFGLGGSCSVRPQEEEGEECGGRKASMDDREEVVMDSDDADDDMMLLEDYQDEEIRSIVKEENHQRLPPVGEPPAELQAPEHQSRHEKNPESKPTDSYSNTSSKISASPSRLKKPAAEPPPPAAAAEPPAAAEPAVKVKNREEPSSASQDSDSKTLSSEESSEEEEEEHEESGKRRTPTSILPTSVLSRAGAIAQHFQGSARRPSQASDDALSPNCMSPRLPSRAGSVLSLKITSPCSDGPEVFRPADANMLLSPRDDGGGGVTGGGAPPQRRDSTLSKHDQLLIGKIKSYYEVAESHDPAFCLRRRESLTSIPTGLVRNSVSHFNCIPTDIPHPGDPGVQGKPSSCAAAGDNGRAPGEPDSGDQGGGIHMKAVSYQPEGTAVIVGGSVGYSSALVTAPVLQEEFRSSSEMIQIWQAMEHDLSRASVRRLETPVQAGRSSRKAAPGLTPGGLAPNPDSPDGDKGAAELDTITEETSALAKQRPGATAGTAAGGPTGRAGSLRETLKLWGEAVPVVRPPRVLELRGGQTQGQSGRLEKDSQDDLDSAKSKVLSLARQYSQRIKTSKPAVRVQAADPRLGKRALACVVEESETSGKPSLSLPLVPGHQPRTGPRLSPVEPGAPGPDPGARARSRSPASPTTMEGFCWPDVRELRSKYGLSDAGPAGPQLPVGRSMSVPEGMATDGGPKRRSSYTSPLLPPAERGGGGGGDEGDGGEADGAQPEEAGRCRLYRTKSLDHRLSGRPLVRLEKPPEVSNGGFHGYYISGEAALPGDQSRRIVVVEKLPDRPAGAAGGEEADGEENLVQIRSPTSREKISIRAVIDRCRAYQETEEYKLREEDAAKTEAGPGGGGGGGRGKEPDKGAASSTEPEGQEPGSTQHSVVRNLREKFQKLK